MDIEKTLASLPAGPGVYLMKDTSGKVIYVGKAANIKKRAASYFRRIPGGPKSRVLVEHIHHIETITTASEHEAFLVESRLIKQLRPHYNISLRDDKSFPFIKITRQDFPRIFIGRRKPHEDVEYIGPYTSAASLRMALKALRKTFKFCTCKRFPAKECLDFHLGLCLGPCTGRVSKKEYKKMIADFKYFLRHGSSRLIEKLERQMRQYSDNKQYEEALQVRERIQSLGLLFAQSKAGGFDIIGLDREPSRIEAFDISNLFGKEAVGSMVTFIDGKPSKNDYRRFRIRMVEGIDDYRMVREVVRRRYSRVIREGLARPDLIVIDGGKGHLSVAAQELQRLEIRIPIIAIAKEQELIYTVSKPIPVELDKKDRTLHLIQRVRDEAHRFALAYHRLLRKKISFPT